MNPEIKTIKELEARHGNEIRKLFGIETSALTASEAQYLIGFKSTDDLRNRVVKARSERRARLAAKGISEAPSSSSPVDQGDTKLSIGQSTKLPTVSERADAILSQPALSWAPVDAIIKTGVKVTGIDRATRALYRKAGFMLDRYTPETIKAGIVADYGFPARCSTSAQSCRGGSICSCTVRPTHREAGDADACRRTRAVIWCNRTSCRRWRPSPER